jgi:hypothetical protein
MSRMTLSKLLWLVLFILSCTGLTHALLLLIMSQNQGNALPSFTSSYLEEKQGVIMPQEEEFIKAASASLYSGVWLLDAVEALQTEHIILIRRRSGDSESLCSDRI